MLTLLSFEQTSLSIRHHWAGKKNTGPKFTEVYIDASPLTYACIEQRTLTPEGNLGASFEFKVDADVRAQV